MQKNKLSFREKTKKLTGKSLFIVTVIIVGLLLLIFAGQLGVFLFYVVVLITLWATRWDWKYFGMTRPNWPNTILKAVFFTISIFILIDFLIQPLVEFRFGIIDLSEASGVEGNFFNYVILILIGWIFGGFCEEIIFRGYLLKRLAIIFGDTNKAWLFSAVIISIVFGIGHSYQGLSGIFITATMGLMMGFIFIFNKNNLMVLVLTHGFYNMIAITLIYLGKASMITDWVHEFFK